MTFKKIEIAGLHPENPIVKIITTANDNVDAIVKAFDDLDSGNGVVGPQGPKGDKGDIGPAGKDGENGKDGTNGVDGKDGTNGQDGAIGPQGQQGIQGVMGPAGADGVPGAAGAKGETGAQGIQGVPGKDGVGILGFASGYVNAGQFVTLDNLKFTVTTSGNRGLSCATVAGTVIMTISSSYSVVGGASGTSVAWPGAPYTTTPSGSWFNYHFPNAGDGSTYLCNDYNNKRVYRVILLIGPSYVNNFISIERLC